MIGSKDPPPAADKDIVQKEISLQKYKVKEKFGLFNNEEAISLDDKPSRNAHDQQIFPKWLTDREDFQYVFPRFATYSIDAISLVAFAMEKDVKSRTSYDINKTVAFMTQFEPLRRLPADLCKNLCKSIRLTYYKPGTTLCTVGGVAQTFFMILQGKVNLINQDGKVVQQIGKIQSFGDNALSEHLDGVYKYTAVTTAEKTTSAKPGNAEDAVVEKATPVVVLEMAAQDYRATRKLYFQSLNHHVSRFLQENVKLFDNWSKHRVNQVAPLLTQRFFRPNEMIQKTGEDAEELFFVHQGVCVVQREIVQARQNRWPAATATGNRESNPNLHDAGNAVTTVVVGKRGYEERQARSIKSVLLAELHAGDYFGEEFLIGYSKRRTTVLAKGNTQVLALPKEYVRNMFTTRMIEELRKKHHAMFTSDEAIMADYEREHALRQRYQQLKIQSFGPKYRQRAERKKEQERLKQSRAKKNKQKSDSLSRSRSTPATGPMRPSKALTSSTWSLPPM